MAKTRRKSRARKKSAKKKAVRAVRRRPDRSAKAVESALAALAHDVRTPLNGILALTELLAASALGERERAWAEAVKNAAEHLARYTTLVCDAVRAEAAGISLRPEPFSPRQLIESVGVSLSARAASVGLGSTVRISGELPEIALGDEVRLRASLENLIDNAVKFTTRGRIAIHAVAEPLPRARVRLTFSISDTGIGLKPAEIKKLFRPFAQASAAVTQRYGGTGLGLSLVKRIARTMDGDLTVSSKPGRGSTFQLSVVVDRANGETQADKAVPAVPKTSARRIKALCVEDSPYGRVVLNTVLSEFGHRADFAGSGEAGVTAASRGGYDIVLIDMTLPGIDGIEVGRRIRALPGAAGRVPLIGVSGRSGAAEEKAARDAGFDVYLPKPVVPAVLADAISKTLP